MKTTLSVLIAAPLVVMAAHPTSLGATWERACTMKMEKIDD